MKKIIALIIILQSLFVIGQDAPKMPKFNAKNSANIFYYELDEVVEKIKIKKDEIENASKKELRIYNNRIKDISFLNFQKLQELELLVNSFSEKSYSDRELVLKVRKKMQETISPIRDSISKNEKELNANLKNVLSKKQFKKFLKYQKNMKKSLLPKPPKRDNPQNSGSSPMSNRRRGARGMGRGGF